ncbi:uncharacterized protein [Spinacia oleracea]|uniref:Reverse transcriptase domain-containing protein n=1 Tax=Spinacia oleracea TaxID=3562 RepID=A0A9R0IG75_SPIOL|nr:uncharacterized protein LOC110787739 [Spinacia oleracea]
MGKRRRWQGNDNPRAVVVVRRWWWLSKERSKILGFLVHVKLPNLGKLYQKIFQNWCFTTNASYHSGGRIVVAWKLGSFNVNITAASSQFVHCHISPVSGMTPFHCTFIYAFNESHMRKELWRDLQLLNVQGPWILCGDFNCVMHMEEKIGMPVRQADIVDISNCMHVCGMEDIKSVGNFFTWNNKQQGQFDHSPGLLTVYPRSDGGRKPFKYFTMWKSSPIFLDTIQMAWNSQCFGSKMYVLTNKLKKVKASLKELNRVGFTDIQAAYLKAHHGMIAAQEAMHLNPHDKELANMELQAIQEYRTTHKAYLDFLKQKAKVEWIKNGDENTSLFHQSIKSRRLQNQVYSIFDKDGVWRDKPDEVSGAFLDYYTELLGSVHDNRTHVIKQIVQSGPICQNHHKDILNAPYTADEVKAALFSIPGVKAPGPDGFGSYFYKDAWSIVGDDVVSAVLDVLQHGKLLKELNHTVITLIPKVKCPRNVSEFRPISCCNTLYKCVTKVLCARLRQILPDLIFENQGGFVHGRYIVHNIMVVQDLVRHYGRKGVKPSCLMKIDLQKAYDTVDWNFLKDMLTYLDFPEQFVNLALLQKYHLTALVFAFNSASKSAVNRSAVKRKRHI